MRKQITIFRMNNSDLYLLSDAFFFKSNERKKLIFFFNLFQSLPQPKMSNSDLGRLMRADEVQRVLRPKVKTAKRRVLKRNPLKNSRTLFKLNPYAAVVKRNAVKNNLGLSKVISLQF